MKYQIAERTDVSLTIYDAAGRMVRTLHSGVREPGYYSHVWNMHDDHGRAVAAGIYFVRFQTDTYQNVDKAVLLR
jgi:flagellar hook assembly protein FlgD